MAANKWKKPMGFVRSLSYDPSEFTEETISAVDALDYFSPVNDDCLLQILEYLDVFELIALRQTSRRFVPLVDEAIGKQRHEDFLPFLIKNKTLYFDLIKSRMSNRKLTLCETERILKCVGTFVDKIHLTSLPFQQSGKNERIQVEPLVTLIDKYCAGGNLTSLHLGKFYLVEDLSRFVSVWENLRVLEIHCFEMWDAELKDIFLQCRNLIHLNVEILVDNHKSDTMESPWKFTGSSLNSLGKSITSMRLSNCKDIQLNELCQFFERNPQMERFSYKKHVDNPIGIILCGQIARRLPNLKHLAIDCTESEYTKHAHTNIIQIQNLNSLTNLKKLTKLMFDACGQDVSSLLLRLAQNNQLEELLLRNAYISDQSSMYPIEFSTLKILKIGFRNVKTIDVSYLKNFKKMIFCPNMQEFHLEYYNAGPENHFVNLVESGLLALLAETPMLEKMFIKIPDFRMNVFHYLAILSTCRARPSKLKLYIYLARMNLTQSLIQHLQSNNYDNLVELRPVFSNFS